MPHRHKTSFTHWNSTDGTLLEKHHSSIGFTQQEIRDAHEKIFNKKPVLPSSSKLTSRSFHESETDAIQSPTEITNMRSLTTNSFISNWTNSFHNYPLAHIPWLPPPTDLPFRVRLVQDPEHGFGILLRRGTYHERVGLSSTGEFLEVRRPALYAEPGSIGICRVGLLPGDRLIALNNTDVQSFVRTDVVALIRSSGDCITLTVKPCPEMLEFSYRTVATQCNISDELAATILMETVGADDSTLPETTHLREASQLEVRSQVLKVGGLKNLSEHILEVCVRVCPSYFVFNQKEHINTL
ncbi:hypothetical protein P879_01214 [Paragonimus westermani]|uniref:PDZ domain-containing protein n=1 Tax=Paragonimus westermani TaxID=34504 RepID=A0A8T0DNZ0_9TREM|nr:hypothetical protein P879_01214 [Paragonimus westermani]